METWLGQPLDCQVVFEPWDTRPGEIDAQFARLAQIWDAGRVPLLTWELFTPTPAGTDDDVLRRGAEGEFDPYLAEWAAALADWVAGPDGEFGTADDRQLSLRPLHEPNGDWYPWAPAKAGCSPATYVRLWRRLHRFVTETGVPDTNVQWIWAVNHADVGDVTAESLFPGETVVDLVGVDGFNWGASQSWSEWQTPATVFEGMADRLESLSDRPVCVPEFGSTSVTVDGHDPRRKNEWLRAAFDYFRTRDIALVSYFDIEKETDWQVFGGSYGANTINIRGTRYQTYTGFRTGVQQYRSGDGSTE